MDTAIIGADPALATRNLLRTLLTGRSETYLAGVVVSTKDPPVVNSAPAVPYVKISIDTSDRTARLNLRASVRVVAYHRDEGLCSSLARLCEALLLASGSADIRGFSPLSSPKPAEDPDTATPISFFTVAAKLRPRNL